MRRLSETQQDRMRALKEAGRLDPSPEFLLAGCISTRLQHPVITTTHADWRHATTAVLGWVTPDSDRTTVGVLYATVLDRHGDGRAREAAIEWLVIGQAEDQGEGYVGKAEEVMDLLAKPYMKGALEIGRQLLDASRARSKKEGPAIARPNPVSEETSEKLHHETLKHEARKLERIIA